MSGLVCARSIMIPAIEQDVPIALTHKDVKQEDSSSKREDEEEETIVCGALESERPKLIEKSVIIHRDENGFGLRVKGQAPVFIEHVHQNGAAWRAGVRRFDCISKVNGSVVTNMDHKEVVLMFKSCTRFIGLTLLTNAHKQIDNQQHICKTSSVDSGPTLTKSSLLIGTIPVALNLSNINSNNHKLNENYPNLISLNFKPSTPSDQALAMNRLEFVSKLKQSAREQISPTSRRSGSVSTRSSYLSKPGALDEEKKPTRVCINCRNLISKQNPLQVTCDECEPRFASASHQRARVLGGSLRDQRQQLDPGSKKINALKAATKQASLSASPTTTALDQIKRPTQVNKRLEIIREFIDTEKAHTDRLRCLDELFYRPLKAGGFMTIEQLRMVFSCHRTLYKIHRQIYRILLSANYNLCSELMIGSALLEIFEGDLRKRLERASCSFCVAQSTNVDLLNKLTRRETKVGEFLAQVTSQQMVGRLGIKDLLASCFQRLTKYPLLLENLLKATPQAPSSGDSTEDYEEAEKEAELEEEAEEIRFENDDSEQKINQQRNSKRMLAISLAEEREFIERALNQSRQMLIRVNEAVKTSASHNKLKEIWKRTDKYPGVPLIDITKQQVVHEGLLTLRLSKRSFDVYVLLLNDYIIILTREGQDKYRLKFFTPEGKSSSSAVASTLSSASATVVATPNQSVYSPVFVIDEHLTTRDAATDENGFYLLCKRKDDSRIYEFASRSPAERSKWRDKIQWAIERQMSKSNSRRTSCDSTITKSSSEISSGGGAGGKVDADETTSQLEYNSILNPNISTKENDSKQTPNSDSQTKESREEDKQPVSEPTKIEGTISYVEDDGIVMPSKMESSRALVDQAVQVNIIHPSKSNNSTQPVPSN